MRATMNIWFIGSDWGGSATGSNWTIGTGCYTLSGSFLFGPPNVYSPDVSYPIMVLSCDVTYFSAEISSFVVFPF